MPGGAVADVDELRAISIFIKAAELGSFHRAPWIVEPHRLPRALPVRDIGVRERIQDATAATVRRIEAAGFEVPRPFGGGLYVGSR